MSLDLHPVSTSQTKVQRLDSHQVYITHHMTLKFTAWQLETAAQRFFLPPAAQLRGNIAGDRSYPPWNHPRPRRYW